MPILNATRNNPLRRRIAWLICLCLAVIALLLLANQYYYQKQNITPATSFSLPPGWPDEDALSAAGLEPLSQPSLWLAANLADKINGKAELYLAAGFVSMHSARFALPGRPELFFEVQLFTHNSEQNAFAVFSQQRRSQARALDFMEHGYTTANALYAQQGPYYLEISGVSADKQLQTGLTAWAQTWFNKQAGNSLSPGELFAKDNLLPDSVMLLAKDAFGLAGFDNVWLAAYSLGDESCLLFVKPLGSQAEAEQQLQALREFWAMQGAFSLPVRDNATVLELEGMYLLFTIEGNYLLGVHEALALDDALTLLAKLKQHLAGL